MHTWIEIALNVLGWSVIGLGVIVGFYGIYRSIEYQNTIHIHIRMYKEEAQKIKKEQEQCKEEERKRTEERSKNGPIIEGAAHSKFEDMYDEALTITYREYQKALFRSILEKTLLVNAAGNTINSGSFIVIFGIMILRLA